MLSPEQQVMVDKILKVNLSRPLAGSKSTSTQQIN